MRRMEVNEWKDILIDQMVGYKLKYRNYDGYSFLLGIEINQDILDRMSGIENTYNEVNFWNAAKSVLTGDPFAQATTPQRLRSRSAMIGGNNISNKSLRDTELNVGELLYIVDDNPSEYTRDPQLYLASDKWRDDLLHVDTSKVYSSVTEYSTYDMLWRKLIASKQWRFRSGCMDFDKGAKIFKVPKEISSISEDEFFEFFASYMLNIDPNTEQDKIAEAKKNGKIVKNAKEIMYKIQPGQYIVYDLDKGVSTKPYLLEYEEVVAKYEVARLVYMPDSYYRKQGIMFGRKVFTEYLPYVHGITYKGDNNNEHKE